MEQRNKSLSQLLAEMKKIWDDYKYTQYQASRELQVGHGGIHQQKMIHCQHLKKKFNFIKHLIKNRISRPGTIVKFKMGNKSYQGTFPSLSREDAIAYIELKAQMCNLMLEILEIQEINSEIKES